MTLRLTTLRIFSLVLLMTAGVPLLPGQRPSREIVSGRVVNALDGHPIAHATVALEQLTDRSPFASVNTDAEGHFHMESVAPGKYSLVGQATGYLSSAYQEHKLYSTAIVTGAGLETNSLVLELTPQARIAGHVLDEAGEPIASAVITLYTRHADGAPEPVSRAAVTQTDDQGAYELSRLAPGRYYLAASAVPWYAVHPRSESPNTTNAYQAAIDPAVDVAYPLVFFPHAIQPEDASLIELRGGEQITANLELDPVKAAQVTLPALQGDKATPQYARVTQSVFGLEENAFSVVDRTDGAEHLLGLAPGHYRITLPGDEGHGPLPLDVTSGTTAIDLTGSAPDGAVRLDVKAVTGESLPQVIQVSLGGAGETVPGNFGILENGTVTLPHVKPGDYRLSLYAQGKPLYVVSLRADGHPKPDKLVHVSESGSSSVSIEVSSYAIELSGVVKTGGKPLSAAVVLLVPADADANPDLLRRDQSDLDGTFTLLNVVPGRYLVLAVDKGWSLLDAPMSAMTPYLPHAFPVEVRQGKSMKLQLPSPIPAQIP